MSPSTHAQLILSLANWNPLDILIYVSASRLISPSRGPARLSGERAVISGYSNRSRRLEVDSARVSTCVRLHMFYIICCNAFYLQESDFDDCVSPFFLPFFTSAFWIDLKVKQALATRAAAACGTHPLMKMLHSNSMCRNTIVICTIVNVIINAALSMIQPRVDILFQIYRFR